MKIGLAEVDITPPVGTPLGGNYRDDYKSKGVFQSLFAHALVIDDGSKEISLVVSDLLGVTAQMVKKVRKKVHTSCGLKEEQVMVAATHTHSGPDTVGLAPESKVEEKTLEMIVEKIALAVKEAYVNKVPAKISFASTKEEWEELEIVKVS
jgi:predicted neutral ceramidase superfamily lipid hydrolase